MNEEAEILLVLLHGELLGELRRSRRGASYSFQYHGSWLERPGATQLSRSLPLSESEYDFEACRPFFAGLLPEGPAREALARVLRVSPDNDFLLLDRVGGDCAGAVSVVSRLPNERDSDPDIEWLSDGQLAARLEQLPVRPFLAGGSDGVRLSLAGTQQKLPVHFESGRFGLPLGRPSTHIIKVAIPHFEGTVANEAFCLHLAAALGVTAVEATPMTVGEVAFLLVARYDRERLDASVVRIHQEDACQALGLQPGVKYENEGGPSVADLVTLVRQASAQPGADVLRLIDLIVINFLLGNGDAHGKNFSLLYSMSGTRLAPAYDLVSTALYPELDTRMAMRIGREYRPERLARRHWERLAYESGLSSPRLVARAASYAERAPQAADAVASRLAEAGQEAHVVRRVASIVDERSTMLLASLTDGEAEALP